MNHTFIEREIEKAEIAFSNAIERMATVYHRDVLTPFCKKHKLEFTSGMGQWSFNRGDIVYAPFMGDNPKYFDGIFKTLTRNVNRVSDFGDWLNDVRAA